MGTARAKGLWHVSCQEGRVREVPSHVQAEFKSSGPSSCQVECWGGMGGRPSGFFRAWWGFS